MNRWRVLVTAPRAVEALHRYREELGAAGCDVVPVPVVERLEEADLLPLVGDVDAMVCGDDRITARVLDAAPRLRVIAKWGTGIDAIDTEAAAHRGVAVRNVPDAFSGPVADTVLGYVLLFARGLARMDGEVRRGDWRRHGAPALAECTLGIVGFGNAGRAVARRARPFGVRMLVSDSRPVSRESAAVLGVEPVPLNALLEASDFVTLHATLDPVSRHLINEDRLGHMKTSAVLINTARGGLVDEAALAARLRDGRLGGAALDVFEREPLPADSPLRGLPNVYLAPHNANASPRAADRVHAATIRHVLAALEISR
jgi:D-3-phosphoglycerate dehydrogenase